MSNSRRPPSRRNTEYALQQHERALQAMVPGTLAGRMASAAPVWQVGGTTITAEGNDGLGGGAFGSSLDVFKNDEQFVTVSGTDTFTLEFVPVPGSVHVSLNGLNLTRDSGSGGEYTVNGKDIILDATADAGVGWDVDVHYVYRSDFDDVPTDATDTYRAAVLADNPVAYYRLDETSGTTLVDASGNGRDGTYVALPPKGAPLAANTDGSSNAYANTGKHATVPYAAWMTTTALSLEFWINNPASLGTVLQRPPGVIDTWFVNIITGGAGVGLVRFGYYNTAGGIDQSTNGTVDVMDGQTHHVVVTHDGGTTISYYIDGVLDRSQSATSGLWAGANGHSDFRITDGAAWGLDEVAVYDYALDLTQVSAHYQAGLP